MAMADIADEDDAREAIAAGADILATTLSGYTGAETPEDPDLPLVRACARLSRPVFAEGRIRTPAQAAAAIAAGAFAVVVGSAITRLEHITGWFAAAVAGAS
jgi:putative N-acetylmannosamine-6-phosphate epimerase